MSFSIFLQFALASVLIGVTTATHAVAIVTGRKIFRPVMNQEGVRGIVSDTVRLVCISLWLFGAHIISIWLWAAVYLEVGVNKTLEEALYFSLVTYSTLGFGDIIPPEGWRLLTGASAANGLLLIGLSGAVLIDFTERLRRGDH